MFTQKDDASIHEKLRLSQKSENQQTTATVSYLPLTPFGVLQMEQKEPLRGKKPQTRHPSS